MRGDHYAISCFHYEVSQASHIQDEDITPLYYLNVMSGIVSTQLQNYKNSLIKGLYLR